MGQLFRARMQKINSPLITSVRGKGLLNALVIKPFGDNKTAYDVCLALKEMGILAKQTHTHIIRFAPTLVINEQQLNEACDIIEHTILTIEK